jgi:hypothetical protein
LSVEAIITSNEQDLIQTMCPLSEIRPATQINKYGRENPQLWSRKVALGPKMTPNSSSHQDPTIKAQIESKTHVPILQNPSRVCPSSQILSEMDPI